MAFDWKADMARALAEGGCADQSEWATRHPGIHCWFTFHDLPSCALCGTVRRRDDRNKPCKGIVTIGLRQGIS